MSKYEMMDYDELLRRVGITPGGPGSWRCGDNPPEEWSYEQAGFDYDDVRASYSGRNQGHGTLCLSEDINVNGLLLNHRDSNGTIWLCTGIEGWWTLPPSEIAEVPKPFWDGAMLTTGRYAIRTITISGCFIPPDPAYVWYNRDALIRVASIVRGVGLLAMCGNESPLIRENSPFYDPPKMALIQMADVPLIETTRPNGFTQFSLSFKCVQPTKLSVYEKSMPLPFEVIRTDPATGERVVTRERYYKAFSHDTDAGDTDTTEYEELWEVEGKLGKVREYADVKGVSIDALISGEELTEGDYDETAYKETSAAETIVLHNSGNYFAFPIFVFGGGITGATSTKKVTVQNFTTGEKMEIQKDVASNHLLVIDTGMRRVGVMTPFGDTEEWKWDDRSHLSLTSQWINLAPGDNTLIVSRLGGSGGTSVPQQPRCYWRDTWIG